MGFFYCFFVLFLTKNKTFNSQQLCFVCSFFEFPLRNPVEHISFFFPHYFIFYLAWGA